MSHSVSVFIAGEPAIRKLSAALGNAPFHHIRNDGWFFLPVTDEIFDLATSLKGDSDPVREGYYRFSKSLALIAGECSDAGPIAHVFTDYFGGEGTQGATVWKAGTQQLQPDVNRLGAINAALRSVGVTAVAPMDEFDTIGLGGVRSNDDFETSTPKPTPAAPEKPGSWIERLFGSGPPKS
jgi:hypothetical protein